MPRVQSFGWLGQNAMETDNVIRQMGLVVPFQIASPGGQDLLTMDAVYLAGSRIVDKSTSAANQALRVGVVVAGGKTDFDIPAASQYGPGNRYATQRVAASNTAVAGGAQPDINVLVCIFGVCYVVCDSAMAVGTPIKLSSVTAGQVGPAAALSIAAGATAVTSVAANGATDIAGDGQNRILGMLLDSSAGAGSICLAYIYPGS